MKRLLALMGFFPLVWVRDNDGDIVLRRAYRTIPPVPIDSFGLPVKNVRAGFRVVVYGCRRDLLEGGGCDPYASVNNYRWREWEHNRKHVVFE